MGVFVTIMIKMPTHAQEIEIVLINATHATAPWNGLNLAAQKGGGRERLIGSTHGGLNSNFNVLDDARGRQLRMFLLACQT